MEAWVLYAIPLLWQFPHFMAIAWMYREDYDRAGYFMLPKGHARLGFLILGNRIATISLVPISTVQSSAHPAVFRGAGLLLGLGFLYFGLRFALQRSRGSARELLAASIVYLPVLFALRVTLR